ncbi:hypothetical protein AAG570_011595 [Ranatra chinensis]|uniref:Uncharacterized protein n=1 Tax=Ranatra chinensis TaxID=642074 RepID=A0ABD0YL53_9HEMI
MFEESGDSGNLCSSWQNVHSRKEVRGASSDTCVGGGCRHELSGHCSRVLRPRGHTNYLGAPPPRVSRNPASSLTKSVWLPAIHGIDAALLTETHFTNRSHCHITDYVTYRTDHPDCTAHGGTAILIRQRLSHHVGPSIWLELLHYKPNFEEVEMNDALDDSRATRAPAKSNTSKERVDWFVAPNLFWLIAFSRGAVCLAATIAILADSSDMNHDPNSVAEMAIGRNRFGNELRPRDDTPRSMGRYAEGRESPVRALHSSDRLMQHNTH